MLSLGSYNLSLLAATNQAHDTCSDILTEDGAKHVFKTLAFSTYFLNPSSHLFQFLRAELNGVN